MDQNKDLVCYRQKQSFRQLVLKPGFRPKGRALGMKEKSENFNSLRAILFDFCKKNYKSSQNKLNNFLLNKTYRFTSRNNKKDLFSKSH